MPASKFDLSVYRVVSRIPRGRVATYAVVARALRCGSARAIGQALRRNPFAPEVPCHRVISSSLSLGGFQGHRQGAAIDAKRALLKNEGVGFDSSGRLLDSGCVLTVEELGLEAMRGAV